MSFKKSSNAETLSGLLSRMPPLPGGSIQIEASG
jgi:hypothetical protein